MENELRLQTCRVHKFEREATWIWDYFEKSFDMILMLTIFLLLVRVTERSSRYMGLRERFQQDGA